MVDEFEGLDEWEREELEALQAEKGEEAQRRLKEMQEMKKKEAEVRALQKQALQARNTTLQTGYVARESTEAERIASVIVQRWFRGSVCFRRHIAGRVEKRRRDQQAAKLAERNQCATVIQKYFRQNGSVPFIAHLSNATKTTPKPCEKHCDKKQKSNYVDTRSGETLAAEKFSRALKQYSTRCEEVMRGRCKSKICGLKSAKIACA